MIVDLYGGPGDGFSIEHEKPPLKIKIKIIETFGDQKPCYAPDGPGELYNLIFKDDKPYYVHHQIKIGQWLQH